MPDSTTAQLRELATRIRLDALDMVSIQGFGYLGQALSAAEQFAVLFGDVLRHGRDRFVLSPGHYAVAFYAAAAEVGLLDRGALAAYGTDGALLEAISTERTPGLDLTCGSLGQGLSGAIGLALGDRLAGEDRRTYAFLSDGELEEGQVWEAAMFAAHHALGGLTVLLDANGSQVDGPITTVTTIEPVADKWRAFSWHVQEVDGHDIDALRDACAAAAAEPRPSMIIARTDIRGRLQSVPSTADGHFLKLDADLERALRIELQEIAEALGAS
ncbi:MAG TPA: 1-deoxy-D-xylulose-5-phosphate synthase N-terminal domain-containing protein [Solirubrobacteraceae bacterium]|nr:1-deoxy-D-xylulose-5-phosphate synthase N-terminal domain-containing protein [Solirubrobacteraceae bacterium]